MPQMYIMPDGERVNKADYDAEYAERWSEDYICPLCGKHLSWNARGRASHNRVHVRWGYIKPGTKCSATVDLDTLTDLGRQKMAERKLLLQR